jgi:DNA-binding NarL/FixJ family response regulator
VVVADDNPVVRYGLVSLLESEGIQVVGEAGDGRHALELAERMRPDLVLLDVRMPVADGVTAAKAISRTTPVVMLTYADRPALVRAAIRAGAAGYLVHGTFTPQELAAAVRVAAGGGNPLSPVAAAALVSAVRRDAGRQDQLPPHQARFGLSAREVEVMRLVALGLPNSEIGSRLFLAEKTVKNHLTHIYEKLATTTRAAAVVAWIGIDPDGPGDQDPGPEFML